MIWRKVDNPPLYAGFTFRDMLLRRGIKVGGTVRVGQVPKGAERFHTFVSRRLSEILDDLNKYSNNLVAEMILKSLGAVVSRSLARGVTGSRRCSGSSRRSLGWRLISI